MIDSNLHLLRSFLTEIKNKINVEEIEKSGISELEVRCRSAEFLSKISTGNYDVECRIHSKVLKKLSSRQKLEIYILLRILSQDEKNKICRLVFLDYKNYLTKITFTNNSKYSYLSYLSENQFNYEIDSILWRKQSKEKYFSYLNQRFSNYENKNVFDILIEILLSYKIHLIERSRPKKVQRHRGYRDHGSLGSDFSRTLRQQSQSGEWKEIIEREEREKRDYLQFQLGLAGWI